MPTFASEPLQRSLRRFVTFDQVTCGAAVVVIVAVDAWVVPNPYLLILAAVVGLTAGIIGMGRRPLARGDVRAAILWVAAGNWGVALAATAIAPFCLPITVIAAVLPSVLAVPYVDAKTLTRVNAVSMCVSTLAVVLGSTQDFSGLTEGLEPWIPPVVLVAFVPFIGGLVVMVSTHNGDRLARALADALGANDRLQESETDLRASRARLVAATDDERRRIARDLHDGAQQRLISMAITVDRASRVARRRPGDISAVLSRLSTDLRDAMNELRSLAQGVYPAVLRDRGLREALIELVAATPCRCRIDIDPLPGCAPEIEASVYWCCAEALQNAAKHAGEDANVRVRVAAGEPDILSFVIEDDGPGFDTRTVDGSRGLANMADRIGAVGGRLSVSSAPNSGVRISGAVTTQGGDAAATDVVRSGAGRRHGRLLAAIGGTTSERA